MPSKKQMETDCSAIGSFSTSFSRTRLTGTMLQTKEANLLICTFSEREKAQLLWSRCINTKGYAGANIPCDLHMEHLNRRLKSVIRNMGVNVKPATIVKAGKAIASVHRVCQVFEEQTTAHSHSDWHPFPAFGSHTVLNLLNEEKVFMGPTSVLFFCLPHCRFHRKHCNFISPLTSLMMDQQAKYSPLGLRTEFVGEAQIDAAVKKKVHAGDVQLVYITLECIIEISTYQNMLFSPPYQEKLVALVVDEAHCVKTGILIGLFITC